MKNFFILWLFYIILPQNRIKNNSLKCLKENPCNLVCLVFFTNVKSEKKSFIVFLLYSWYNIETDLFCYIYNMHLRYRLRQKRGKANDFTCFGICCYGINFFVLHGIYYVLESYLQAFYYRILRIRCINICQCFCLWLSGDYYVLSSQIFL